MALFRLLEKKEVTPTKVVERPLGERIINAETIRNVVQPIPSRNWGIDSKSATHQQQPTLAGSPPRTGVDWNSYISSWKSFASGILAHTVG
jgi:hypothetical protein